MSEGSVFDVTLSKTYFEPPKPPLDVKNTTVVLDVIFVGQIFLLSSLNNIVEIETK